MINHNIMVSYKYGGKKTHQLKLCQMLFPPKVFPQTWNGRHPIVCVHEYMHQGINHCTEKGCILGKKNRIITVFLRATV